MLKITPYIPIIIPIVVIGGLFNPLFGYFLLLEMIILMVLSPFKGRFFCGNLCSRGLFNDFILSKISRKGNVPKLFKNMIFRIIVLVIMMSRTIYQIFSAYGVLYKLGAVLLTSYIMQTLIISIIAVTISPRAWCHFCPAGTLQRLFDRKKYLLKANKSKCINCGLCNQICPMSIPVKEIINHPDCIKCGRCIEVCPKKVLRF
jgi:ferredoxin-type protein NapH